MIVSILYYISINTVIIFLLLIRFRADLTIFLGMSKKAIFYSISGTVWLIANLFLALYLSFNEPWYVFFTNFIWKIIALVMFLISIIICLWTIKLFRSKERLLGLKIDVLITKGPYKYTRHPQYLSIILMAVSLLFIINTFQLLVFLISTSISFYVVALIEEEVLEKIFKQEYIKYKKNVSRFIPFL